MGSCGGIDRPCQQLQHVHQLFGPHYKPPLSDFGDIIRCFSQSLAIIFTKVRATSLLNKKSCQMLNVIPISVLVWVCVFTKYTQSVLHAEFR